MDKNNQKQINEIPVGVKIISVLYYIISALLIIILIIGFFSIINSTGGEPIRIVLATIFLLGLASLCFFVGRGLWRGDKGSRITAIAISILGIVVTIIVTIILSILSKQRIPANDVSSLGNIQNILSIFRIEKFIPKAIIGIGINAIIAIYLLFNNKVKEAFKLI